MTDAFESKFGIPTLNIGSPILRILEAAAQSDFRSSNDIFALLRAEDLNQADGPALILIAADEGLTPIAQSPSSGPVQITDTSFTKVASQIYAGLPAPIIGSTVIYVNDASLFTNTGSLYIGRGTTDYEGPIAYTSKTNHGTYWSFALSTGTQNFHNFAESVILAQGGNRTINPGAQVQTAQGNAQSALVFNTLYAATIPDGETTVQNVQVVCVTPGIVGNISAQQIVGFVSPPFSGATATNIVAFGNAQNNETTAALRARIQNTRQTRQLGTPLAIETGVLGLGAPGTNNIITSASVVSRAGYPTTLYIDDGSGLEEVDQGIAYETLTASAVGGEQYFTVAAAPPVAKAHLTTTIAEPYNLQQVLSINPANPTGPLVLTSPQLTVQIAGKNFTHTFQPADFASPSNATAYEVVASINSTPATTFNARTADSGTYVVIFAVQDTDEALQVVVPGIKGYVDANVELGFPTSQAQTMFLYKNDVLLSKDGRPAVVTSAPQGDWNPISTGATINLGVDGTGVNPYTFVDNDFVVNNTGYLTVSAGNSLASWATVFNAKIPGITATATSPTLTIQSNLGNQARAQVLITGGTLAGTPGSMFIVPGGGELVSTGADNDYSLDRNRGEIYLDTALIAGDTLSIGTTDTRAFIQSGFIPPTTILATGISPATPAPAELWFMVDGDAQIIQTGISAATPISVAAYSLSTPVGGETRVQYSATSAIFQNVLVGDWLIVTDWAFTVGSPVTVGLGDGGGINRGAYRISYVDPAFEYVEISRDSAEWAGSTEPSVTLQFNGLVVVRGNSYPQKVVIPAATNYTATSFAQTIAPLLQGAIPETYKTNYLRIRTDTEGTNGNIALVAATPQAGLLLLPVMSATTNLATTFGTAESGNPETGTPSFLGGQVLTNIAPTHPYPYPSNPILGIPAFTLTSAAAIDLGSNNFVVPLDPLPEVDTGTPGYGLRTRDNSNKDFHSVVDSIVTDTTVNLRDPVNQEFVVNDRFYVANPYGFGANDNLTVLVDGNVASKSYSVNLFRNVQPTTTTYGISNYFLDEDNGGNIMTTAFGTGFNFQDFALMMHARTKSGSDVGGVYTADTTKTILWRWYRQGADGNNGYVTFRYPSLPSQGVTATTFAPSTAAVIGLASGTTRTGYTIHSSTYIGVVSAASGSIYSTTYLLGFTASVMVAGSVGMVTVTPPGIVTDMGWLTGTTIWIQGVGGGFVNQLATITRTGALTFTYPDTLSTAGGPYTVTLSQDAFGQATLTGSTIAAGDIISILPASGLPAQWAFPGMIQAGSLAAQHWTTLTPTTLGASTVVAWYPLNDANNFKAFPLNATSNEAVNIAASVNAIATSPVTAVAVGNGATNTGVVGYASYDDPDGSETPSYGYTLSDGINYIRYTSVPGGPLVNYNMTFKNAISASLATNSDWANEQCRLVPQTALNVADYFNSSAIGGLFSSSEIITSSQYSKVQLTTFTQGSTGSIQVQGGLGNAASASVISAAYPNGSGDMIATINNTNNRGFMAGQWVKVANATPSAKPIFTSTYVPSTISNSTGIITMGVADTVWTKPVADITSQLWQIEKQGNFVAMVNCSLSPSSLSGLSEGDFVIVSAPGATTAPFLAVDTTNIGTFRVVRVDVALNTLWIQNSGVKEEIVWTNMQFIAANSIMPGDTFVLSSPSYGGSNNMGTYTVTNSYSIGNDLQFQVTPAPPNNYSGSSALGTDANLWNIIEFEDTVLFKNIKNISPNSVNSLLTDIRMNSDKLYTRVSPVDGSVISVLDKLAFPTSLSLGADAYADAVGLIGAANAVAYGVESDPTTYPGIVAAGAQVNIQGPLVQSVEVSVQIRVISGVSTTDIVAQVQAAIASVINNTGIGIPIALSDLITAAQGVNGVVSVVLLSPVYNSANDLIPVQPFEKPLVLNVNQNITVTLVGT